jgi:AAA ATPase domain
MSLELLADIYSSFDPFVPSIAATYVDFQEARGGWNILRDIGRKITRSRQTTCHLFSGHRGSGKSTELLKLKEYLEQQKYFVVYFTADDDIDPADTGYVDILLAFVRHLAESINLRQSNPLLNWMKSQWGFLKDLALTEVSIDNLSQEAQISQFVQITANLRFSPNKRSELRQKINLDSTSILVALKDFIREVQKSIIPEFRGLVVIADNLDRIVEIKQGNEYSNYDEIYVNRSEIWRNLGCHVILTIPVLMVYSKRGVTIQENYDSPNVLPMIMVRNADGSVNKVGIKKLREFIYKRITLISASLEKVVESNIFESGELIDRLCLMSGGQIRSLMILLQRSIDWTDELPIQSKSVQRAFQESKQIYHRTIEADQWEILARVYCNKQPENNEQYLCLLVNRSILEYCYYDADEILRTWVDVNPLITGIPQFQKALPIAGNDLIDAIDSIVVDGLKEVIENYKVFLERQQYDKVTETASNAYTMLSKTAESLDKESAAYGRVIALAEYWRLIKNLYAVRSGYDVTK